MNPPTQRSVAVILPAGGASVRFGGGSKLLAALGARTVLEWTLDAFLPRADVALVVVAAGSALRDDAAAMRILARERVVVVPGGSTRAASVALAARAVPAEVEFVAVHDAARPLVSQGLIDRVVAAAVRHGAAGPAMPVALTIKESAALPGPAIRTVPRARLFAMQTPQVMRRTDLLAAIRTCPIPEAEVTDDLQLLELAGLPAWLVDGEERNLKITTKLDLMIASILLDNP